MNYGTLRWVNTNPDHSEAAPVWEPSTEPAEYATLAWLRVDNAYNAAGATPVAFAVIPDASVDPEEPVATVPVSTPARKRWGRRKSDG